MSVYILKWIIKRECEEHNGINFFYLKDEMIHCCLIGLTLDETEEFKKIRNKHKFLENKINEGKFILNENINHREDLNDFIKSNRLETKMRNRKLKMLFKK